jgi:RNA polymerase sigma factor (sigma-70 family)
MPQPLDHRGDAPTSDAELLHRFTARQDQAAFAELVRRHAPLVWCVCRQVLPHHADAEDAFQAVFLALVRGAAGIRTGHALPAWLHGVALRVAARLKRASVRRRRREHRVAIREVDQPVSEAAWSRLMAAVHEEIQQLPESERTAFVLCDLQGVRQPDAAARLGWPLGTLSGRLCKARQKLVEQLSRRGIAPSVLALGGIVTSAGSVPAQLVTLVNSFPTAPAAGISTTVAYLATGLVGGLTMRMKLTAAALLVVGAFGFSGGAFVLSQTDAQGPGQPVTATTQPAKPLPPNREEPATVVELNVESLDDTIQAARYWLATVPGAANGQWQPMTMYMSLGRTNWEYKFVDLKSDDRAAFEKAVTTAGNEGWEYAGSERLRTGNEAAQLVLVFKRPAGGMAGGMMGGGGFGGGMGGLGGFGGAPGKPGAPGGVEMAARVFGLKNSKAAEVSAEIEKAFGKVKGFKVIADPVANTIVIFADPATMKEVARLIESREGPIGEPLKNPPPGLTPVPPGLTPGVKKPAVTTPAGSGGGTVPVQSIHVFTLKHANADEIASVLKRVFTTAEITPDPRTNQLIIRSDDRTRAEMQSVLERLDVPIKK